MIYRTNYYLFRFIQSQRISLIVFLIVYNHVIKKQSLKFSQLKKSPRELQHGSSPNLKPFQIFLYIKLMQHQHGPNCGCKDYIGVQNANDLLGAIDIDKVTCLNEQTAGSGKSILKDFDSRFDKVKFVRSDCDGEILLVIPFLAQVKIRSVCVIAKGQTKYPQVMRLYINNQNINFSLTQQEPIQQFPLNANLSGDINHAVKINKFKSVHKLIIHLKNQNEEHIEVSYVQIKGQNTNIKRQAVQTVYEIQPNAQKKDLKDLSKMGYEMH